MGGFFHPVVDFCSRFDSTDRPNVQFLNGSIEIFIDALQEILVEFETGHHIGTISPLESYIWVVSLQE